MSTTPSCVGCDARKSEIEWLREQVETLMSRVLALSHRDSATQLTASEAARFADMHEADPEESYAYSLPPSVEEACLAMSSGDGQLYRELAAWASRQKSQDWENAEDVADMIYQGRQL